LKPDTELDSLLAEALAIEFRNHRGKGSINRLEAIKEICHQTYTNPDNWRLGPLVELHHRESGSFIGVFREHFHKKVNARKLVRVDAEMAVTKDEIDSPPTIQFVEGPEWLGGPFVHNVDPPTEDDIRAVRQYYRPHYWRPAWMHLKGNKQGKTADALLDELAEE
jgi:hypothetical protein